MNLENGIFTFQNLLSEKDFNLLQSFTKNLTFPDTPSFVFHREEKRNKIDEDVRKSHTLHIRDSELLHFVKENLLTSVTSYNKDIVLSLARDYVTFIRYDSGGFFDWHTDFEKVTVNDGQNIKEMHLLFCVDAPEDGGDLLVKRDNSVVTVEEARIEGGCVIFDKLLEHKGDEVRKGTKMILTVDVFVTTVYSNLHINDEKRFTSFVSGHSNHFMIGSYAQFKTLYENVEKAHPEYLQRWVPFLQLSIEAGNQTFEVDFLPNVGLCRLEFEDYSWRESETKLIRMAGDYSDFEDKYSYLQCIYDFLKQTRIKMIKAKKAGDDMKYNFYDGKQKALRVHINNVIAMSDFKFNTVPECDKVVPDIYSDNDDDDDYDSDDIMDDYYEEDEQYHEYINAYEDEEHPIDNNIDDYGKEYFFFTKEDGIFVPPYSSGPPDESKHYGFNWNEWRKTKSGQRWNSYQPFHEFMEAFREKHTPSDIFSATIKYFSDTITSFDLRDGDNCLDSVMLPNFSSCSSNDASNKMSKSISLPQSISFTNCPSNYKLKEAGYTYHCNESNYDSIAIKFRYGFVNYEESMAKPAEFSCQ